MRVRRLINSEPLKIPLHLKKHSYPDCHTLSIRSSNIPPHACEGGNTRASSPSSRAPRAFLCARHNSYAPSTKGRMKLDKNSHPSGNQCCNIWDSNVANKFDNGTLWRSLGILKFPQAWGIAVSTCSLFYYYWPCIAGRRVIKIYDPTLI